MEGELEDVIVGLLYPLCDGISIGFYLVGADNLHLEERDNRDGKDERHHQVDGNGDGEIHQTIMENALHRKEEGVEDGADADGGQHHRHEVLLGRPKCCFVGFQSFAEILQVAIDDNDAVVDNHSQHYNKRGQSYDVEFNTHHIHDCHRYESTERDSDSCNDC